MTELLQRAIAELGKLPPEAQDAIATRLLADIADDRAWAARFAATTDEQWDRLAEQVRHDLADGDAISLEEIFSRGAPGG